MNWVGYSNRSAKNKDQSFLFSKLDISDSFWRVKVRNDDRWNFCYVLPSEISDSENAWENIEIVVPSSLQMGWTESPLFLFVNRNCTGPSGRHDEQRFGWRPTSLGTVMLPS